MKYKHGHTVEDTVLSLGNRLVRLARQLDDKGLAKIKQASGGPGLQGFARGLVQSLDAGRVVASALDAAKASGVIRDDVSLTQAELDAPSRKRVDAACLLLDALTLRDLIASARREREHLIDHHNPDTVTHSEFAAQAQANAEASVSKYRKFLESHCDDIAALGFFYAKPYRRRALMLGMIEELLDTLSRPPLMLTTETMWSAYARVQETKVRGNGARRQLTDLVSLVRFALGMDDELRPFTDTVDKRFADWVFRHNARRATAFTPEQMEWLRLVKDHIASSSRIERDDFDYAQLAGKGGLQKAWNVFGVQLDELLVEMNEELVA